MKANQLLDDLADNLEAVIKEIALSKAERIIFQSAFDCLQNVSMDAGFIEVTENETE